MGRGSGFAVLFLPDFALQAAGRMEPDFGERPFVLVEERGRKVVAIQLNRVARGAGVFLGMTVSQVLARAPDAVVKSRSCENEKLTREMLLAAALTLSPCVEESGEGVCTIDLAGILEEGKERRALGAIGELGKAGFEAKAGFGENPLLALFAAKRAEPVLVVEDERTFLAGLPLEVAEPSPTVSGILHQWGVRTLGALAALGREEVAKRLGVEGIALWDRASGRCERVLRPAVLPEKFEEEIELEEELERLEPLLFLLRRLVGQLGLRLAAAGKVAEEVRINFGLSDRSDYGRVFRLPEPGGDPELIFRMLHTWLENVRTEHPIVKIGLWMKPCRPVVKQNELFEATVKDPCGFAETLARLAAIVGSENVGSPRLEPTHRPDAFRLEPLSDVGGWEEEDLLDCGFEKPPMRRFRPPVSARVWLEEGRPVYLKSEIVSGRIDLARGPWRISGDWWDLRRWSRDEWDVRVAGGGGWYRLFRERTWFVEGELEIRLEEEEE